MAANSEMPLNSDNWTEAHGLVNVIISKTFLEHMG